MREALAEGSQNRKSGSRETKSKEWAISALGAPTDLLLLLVLRCSNQNVEMVNQKCKHGRRRRSKCKDVASASSSFI